MSSRIPAITIRSAKNMRTLSAISNIEFNCLGFRESGKMIVFQLRRIWSDDSSVILGRVFASLEMAQDVKRELLSRQTVFRREEYKHDPDFESWEDDL